MTTNQARREKPTYDEWRIAAKHLCWLCCKREVFSTNPEAGCIACR